MTYFEYIDNRSSLMWRIHCGMVIAKVIAAISAINLVILRNVKTTMTCNGGIMSSIHPPESSFDCKIFHSKKNSYDLNRSWPSNESPARPACTAYLTFCILFFFFQKFLNNLLCKHCQMGSERSPTLDAQKDLFDGNRRTPILLLVQEGEADGAGGVDVGMKEWWLEFALGWTRGEVIFEDHSEPKQATLPWRLQHKKTLSWNVPEKRCGAPQ